MVWSPSSAPAATDQDVAALRRGRERGRKPTDARTRRRSVQPDAVLDLVRNILLGDEARAERRESLDLVLLAGLLHPVHFILPALVLLPGHNPAQAVR